VRAGGMHALRALTVRAARATHRPSPDSSFCHIRSATLSDEHVFSASQSIRGSLGPVGAGGAASAMAGDARSPALFCFFFLF
jgi:hypothetical protein